MLPYEFFHERSGPWDGLLQSFSIPQFTSRPLQHNILMAWNKHAPSPYLPVHLSSQARNSLSCWVINSAFLPYLWKVIMTYACLSGWERLFQSFTVQGTWSLEQAKLGNQGNKCSSSPLDPSFSGTPSWGTIA